MQKPYENKILIKFPKVIIAYNTACPTRTTNYIFRIKIGAILMTLFTLR